MAEKRYKDIKRAGILGIVGNIFLLMIKASIGILSGSQSMIADSVNSASDILASLMTFIGGKISSEPKDENHNFGHGKAEYIFSLLISIVMIIAATKLMMDSALSLLHHDEFTFSWFLIIVCAITIITKFSLYLYTRAMYKKYESILLKSNYKDHRNDCIVTTCTLASIICGYLGIFWVDGIVGIGISFWILVTGFGIFVESYNILMDVAIDEDLKNTIIELVKSHEEIKNCYNFYSTPVGYQYFVIFTIAVDGGMPTRDSHNLANHLEKDIEKMEKIYKAVVHVHPVDL